MNKDIKLIIIIIVIGIVGVSLIIKLNKDITPNDKQNMEEENTEPAPNAQALRSFDIQGMKVDVIKEGEGEATSKVGDAIEVHYTGTLTDGTKFDSSVDRGETFPYTLGENRVIKGWELGLLDMKVGEKRILTIPSDLAYGPAGRPPVIPQSATLIFEVEMMSIN